MYVPSKVFWALLILILLVVSGSMAYSIYVLTTLNGSTSDALYVPTIAAIVVSSVSLAALLVVFISYTAMSYNRGNWLQSLVDGTVAKKNRLRDSVNEKKLELQRMVDKLKDQREKRELLKLRLAAGRKGFVVKPASEDTALMEAIKKQETEVAEEQKELRRAEELAQKAVPKGELPTPLVAQV